MTALFCGAIGCMIGAALTFLLVPLARENMTKGLGPWLLVAVAFALPTLAFGLYLSLGEPAAVTPAIAAGAPAMTRAPVAAGLPAPAVATQPGAAQQGAPSVASLLERLEQRLRDEPADASGWLLLARSYGHVGRIEEARTAYRQAVVLGAEDAQLAAQLHAAAAPTGSATPTGSGTLASGGGGKAAGVRGTVRLDAAVAERVAADDTVFIFAKTVDGQPMPLAVMRTDAGHLPFDFVLDDSLAMTTNLKLSAFEEVLVTAKISKSGDAAAAADLSAPSRVVRVGDANAIELVIGGG